MDGKGGPQVPDVQRMYRLCCQYMHRRVWVYTRTGRWYHGQIVGVDGRNVYLRMMPWPYRAYGVAGSEASDVDLAIGSKNSTSPGVVIQETQLGFGFGGVAALGLFSILAITLAAPRFGYGFGGY